MQAGIVKPVSIADVATISGLVVATTTLLFGLFGLKERFNHDYLTTLEGRLKAAEQRAREAEETCSQLRQENVELMRKLVGRRA